MFGAKDNELPFQYVARTTSRTKRLSVSVHPGGRVTVSYPRRIGQRGVEQFLRQHTAWILGKIERMRTVVEPQERLRGTRTDYLARKEAARARVTERLSYWRGVTGIQHGRVAIKNMSTQWGSCSRDKNLNFHYKCVDLPQDLFDYLLVHELSHCVHLNHGVSFWRLVGKYIPNVAQEKRRLRRYFHQPPAV